MSHLSGAARHEHPEDELWPIPETRPGEQQGDPPRLHRGLSDEQFAPIEVSIDANKMPVFSRKH